MDPTITIKLINAVSGIPILSRATSKKEAIIWCKGPCFGLQDLMDPEKSKIWQLLWYEQTKILRKENY
uniref:Uncharacterized protein n=1 Tax=Rhizophagus irregularis (strain DAOM 181602 / DAOM 197198 / MUCL 43194) TaxID=747089 RepID=U9TA04_RHIID